MSPGQTQDMLKRSYLLAGLVALGFPPDKGGGGGRGEGGLGLSAQAAA